MNDELNERKQAMLMYHLQQLSKAEICRRLKHSRPWLDRWLDRYDPAEVEHSLRDHPSGPPKGTREWSNRVHQQVIDMRRTRSQEEQWRYAFLGAEAIHLELKALGNPEVPPTRTIHRWFVAAGLVDHSKKQPAKRETKPIPIPAADAVNRVQQLDLKGPVYLEGSPAKYYLAVLRDRFSHHCAIRVLENREAQNIVAFLVDNWRWMGLPDYLQLDNALEFRGSNRYPRSFGKIVRVALDLQVEVLFNPPSEPWRNGGVEWFNGFLNDRLLKVRFNDLQAFQVETLLCQQTCNQTHRLAAQNGSTPSELAANATLHYPTDGYRRHLSPHLPQDHGFVSFVRLVRKSGRITLGAGDRFMVDPNLAYQYVLARADLMQNVVCIWHNDQMIHTYDFSPDTVGAWAYDDDHSRGSVDDEILKVQTTM